MLYLFFFFFFKQKTAYEISSRDWSSDVCSSDLLYRTNAQSRALEDALRRDTIPYRLVGSVRFYDRREIRDLMAYLKLIANPSDEEAFRRAISVPKRGIGDTTVDALAARAREAKVSLSEAAAREDLQGSLRPAARK